MLSHFGIPTQYRINQQLLHRIVSIWTSLIYTSNKIKFDCIINNESQCHWNIPTANSIGNQSRIFKFKIGILRKFVSIFGLSDTSASIIIKIISGILQAQRGVVYAPANCYETHISSQLWFTLIDLSQMRSYRVFSISSKLN